MSELLWIAPGEQYEGVLQGNVIEHEGGFSFDFTQEDIYTVKLVPQGVNYKLAGESTIRNSQEKCLVTADLYHNDSGIALTGNWIEDGTTYKWFAFFPKERIKKVS
jgi:hypothetical protein